MIAGFAENSRRWSARKQYQLLLIFAVLLSVYFPVISGNLSNMDDITIIENIKRASCTLRDLFIPHTSNGLYYRPVLFLTYYADKYLFQLDPGFMHLENVILHAINALLIFWLAGQLISERKEGGSLIPLMSALFFGLHPIATESVSWIAGRTDVLACAFILLSANCIIRFKKNHSYWYAAASALSMVLGFLTKEVAIAFLPGAFLLMNSPLPSEAVSEHETSSKGPQHRYDYWFLFLFGFGAILIFFLLRHFAFSTNKSTITVTLLAMRSDPILSALVFLKTLGFYAKKMLFPFPLNFAIVDVDPLYELLGGPIVFLCLLILSKRNQLSALFMTGILLITPSFLIAFGQIAWTPFAERYLYLSTAFIMTAAVFFVGRSLEKLPSLSWKKEVFIALLLAVMAVTTFQRSMVWKDNLSLLKETVEKNPDFCYIRGQYALALALRGDIKSARIQYTIANEYNKTRKRLKTAADITQLQYWDMPELGLADLLVRENRIPEAITAYEKIISESKKGSFALNFALNNVFALYGSMLNETKNSFTAKEIKKKMSSYFEKYNSTLNDADMLYLLAKVFLIRGEKRESLAYFKKAESNFGADNKYKIISQKFIARLENM